MPSSGFTAPDIQMVQICKNCENGQGMAHICNLSTQETQDMKDMSLKPLALHRRYSLGHRKRYKHTKLNQKQRARSFFKFRYANCIYPVFKACHICNTYWSIGNLGNAVYWFSCESVWYTSYRSRSLLVGSKFSPGLQKQVSGNSFPSFCVP